MTREEAILGLRAAAPVPNAKGVTEAWRFGLVARGEATEASSMDVAIQVADPDRPGIVESGSHGADRPDALETDAHVVPWDDIAGAAGPEAGFRRDAVRVP